MDREGLSRKGAPFHTVFNFYSRVVAMIFDLEAKECVHFFFFFFKKKHSKVCITLMYSPCISTLRMSRFLNNICNDNCNSLCWVISSPQYFPLKVFQGFTSIPSNHPLTTAHSGWAFRATAWCALLHLRACPSLPLPVSVSLQLFHKCLRVRVCKNQNCFTFAISFFFPFFQRSFGIFIQRIREFEDLCTKDQNLQGRKDGTKWTD